MNNLNRIKFDRMKFHSLKLDRLKMLPIVRLWALSTKKGLFFFQIVLQVLLTGTSIYVSHLSKKAIDEQFVIEQFTLVAVTFALIVLIGIAAQYLGSLAGSLYAITLTRTIRELSMERLIHCQYAYIEQKHSGTILNRLNNDVEQVSDYLSYGFPDLLRNSITFVCTAVYLLTVNWMMTCVCAVCVPIAVMITKKFADPTYQVMNQFFDAMDSLSIMAKDSVSNAGIEKAYNLQKSRANQFNHKMDGATKLYISRERLMSNAGAYKYLLKSAPTFICIMVAFLAAHFGRITSGSFAAFILLMGNITDPLSKFITYITEYKEAEVSMNRVLEILDLPQEPDQIASVVDLKVDRQKSDHRNRNQQESNQLESDQQKISHAPCYEFREVSFTYPELDREGEKEPEQQDRSVLTHLSGMIRQGEMTAIVGNSGGGKSTIFKILAGFYPVSEGEILLYGENLSNWPLEEMRKRIAYVEQMPVLLQGTIADNIAMGKEGATLSEIVKAAKMAYAHEFIMQQPDGYQTVLKEGGSNLSGGQRQRIAIARAFIKDAPILLMDEMTSALDVESEKLIQQAMEEYRKDKTIVIIAHRLSTIRSADHIMVLKSGQVVEEGTHLELIQQGREYAHLYEQNLRKRGEVEE